MTKIFLHGSGHQAASWRETIAQMPEGANILRPNLAALLEGRPACFDNLCAAFAEYCAQAREPLDLCGLSLGGIVALAYALDHPQKVRSLVLIGTPHKVPKAAFALQNLVFRFLPAAAFRTMAFDKADTFAPRKFDARSGFQRTRARDRLPDAHSLRRKGPRQSCIGAIFRRAYSAGRI